MNIRDAFPSKYLAKEDVVTPLRRTISKVVKEELGFDDKKLKPVIYFAEGGKGFVANRTNCDILEDAFSEKETDFWVGKVIELYFDPAVSYGGKRTGGIRVRVPMPTPLAAPTPLTPPALEDYKVDVNGTPIRLNRHQLQSKISDEKLNPDQLMVLKIGADEGWKPAAEYGFSAAHIF